MRNAKPELAHAGGSGSRAPAKSKQIVSHVGRRRRPRPFTDVVALLESALDRVAGRARARGIVLDCETPAAAPIAADPLLVIALIEGLLVNALARSPAGGTVTCSITHAGRSICIEVCDGGPRLQAEDLNRLLWPTPVTIEAVAEDEGLLDSRWTAIVKTFDPARVEGRSNAGGASFKLTLPVY